MRNVKNPSPLQNDADPLSGLQRNALASLVRFVTKRTRDASALRWRPKRVSMVRNALASLVRFVNKTN